MRRGPTVFLLLILLAAAAYGSYRAMDVAWTRVVEFAPSYLSAQKPTAGPSPLAAKVVLVVADGLRPNDAALLPAVDWLEQRGAVYALSAPLPSYQVPVTATLLTGAPAELHGVLLPQSSGPLAYDSLLTAARRARLTSGGVGGQVLGKLVASGLDQWQPADTPDQVVTAARGLMAANGPNLTVVQLTHMYANDQKVRSHSISDPEYVKLMAEADGALVRLLDVIDWKTTAVVLVGTLPDQPGHPLPLVMAGAGVKPGVRGQASLLDVAPTVSALLGAPMPFGSQGKPLMGALAVTGRPADVVIQRAMEARKAYADALLLSIGSAEKAAAVPEAAAEFDRYTAELDQQVKSARFAVWKQSLVDQLPYLGGALLVLLLYVIVVWRQPFGGTAFLSTLLYGGVFHGTFVAVGGRYSAALAGLEQFTWQALLRYGLAAAGAMALASLLAGYLLSRKGFKKKRYLGGATLHMALSTAALIALPIVIALAFVGWEFPVVLPSAGLLVWFFATGLQVLVIGALSPLWLMLAVNTARAANALWPLPESGDPERNADKEARARTLRRAVKR